MTFKRVLKDRLVIYILSALLIVMASFVIVNILTSYFSLGEPTVSKWDGVSISSSFSSGNGTEANPYIINNGADLAYFKSLIEGLNSDTYNNAYYRLGNDIDLGDNEFTSIGKVVSDEERFFKGTLDGNGYTIRNVKVIGNTINNYDMYGLFTVLSGGNVSNVNLENFDIYPSQNNNPLIVGTVAGEVRSSSTVKNVSIFNGDIDLLTTSENTKSKIGSVLGSVASDVDVSNIYINTKLSSKYSAGVAKVSHTIDSNLSNIIVNVDTNSLMIDGVNNFATSSNGSTINNLYTASIDKGALTIKKDNSNVSIDKITTILDEGLTGDFYWSEEAGVLRLFRVKVQASAAPPVNFAFGNSVLVEHESGIVGDTVYVNDLDSDYNNFMGLNYTDYTDSGTLPTGVNRNLYNDSNLVKVFTKYDGMGVMNNDLVGYVSLNEKQSKFIYYNYYQVVDGYVTFPLIDNPFADRPNDMAFNGWVTDYPGAYVYLDKETYTRYVKIPVSNVNDVISIEFRAGWVNATTYQLTGNNNNYINELNAAGMKPVMKMPIYEDVDATKLYLTGTVNNWRKFPNNSFDDSGNDISGNRCNRVAGCTYYYHPTDPSYNGNLTYYELVNGTMRVFVPKIIGYGENPALIDGASSAGLFKEVRFSMGNRIDGYYDNQGNLLSGTCNSNSCTYYKYLQYYDDAGNENVYNKNDNYYYLVTRDTNIVVLRNNVKVSLTGDKPFTLTGINNDNDYSASTFDIRNNYVSVNNDVRIEHITLTSNRNQANTSPLALNNLSSYIYGNWHNFKIGRGIKRAGNSVTSTVIMGGNGGTTGSSNDLTRYTFVIESGFYNSVSITNCNYLVGENYIDGSAVYGNDYDRVNNNNDSMDVYYSAAGSWEGRIYGDSEQTGIALHTKVKSGRYGSGKYDYSTGIYVGGRGVNGGIHYAAREADIEGGWIYNLNGGPLTDTSRTNINDTYMNIKGGSIDMVYGGAGATATYGNRIINLTGGTVNYSVFGGSNGYTGSDGGVYEGTLEGNTFIYVGGNAVVGDDNLISSNSSLFGAEAGSVFGIGNGNDTSSRIGSANSSNIIIDGNATIKRNVYGGGNYGAVGINASGSSTTNIKVLNGNINGSIYGGGNNNGSGTETVNSAINITMKNGQVNGSIYGGSKSKGIVYGNTKVLVEGGNVLTDVYGGGEGGYTDNTQPGTFVTGNVDVTIGNKTNPVAVTIDGNVYGGSAYGTVNGSSNTTDVSLNSTKVLVNAGTIAGSVFGGGKGNSTFTPYVLGNVLVTINDGNIGKVFGGNDAKGSPNGEVLVYLNGGTIGDAFGGGNSTGQNTTNIYLQGATVKNLFGGSNLNGVVSTANVTMTSGTVTNIYGGNNDGTSVGITNVIVSDGKINGDIYGGGLKAPVTGTSNVTVTAFLVNNVYGGGQEADVAETIVNIKNVTANNIFGGSNTDGIVGSSKVTIDKDATSSGSIQNVYGGNNAGGTLEKASVTINDGIISNVYGGGNLASTGEANVVVKNGTITNVFGGGNEAGITISDVDILGGLITNVYGGSNKSGIVGTTDIVVGENVDPPALPSQSTANVTNIYGGNNLGGSTGPTKIVVNSGIISDIYGGGNKAVAGTTNVFARYANITNIYGGGKAATVNGNTLLDIDNCSLNTNVFGGGDEGEVTGNTDVYITDSSIQGSLYAGGNGKTATVYGNTNVTVDGSCVIGSKTSKAPYEGSVFGGGNQAFTGTESVGNSTAIVNIVGGEIYGNVYGGANTSIVYGGTITNIGSNVVLNKTLKQNDVIIHGTVFGGGEANASGDPNYDFDFNSVVGSIDINIDGTDYLNNGYKFELFGSIFGSGNASSSSGTSNISIKKLGTQDNPSKNVSIQRTNNLLIDNSFMELSGIEDSTNDFETVKYSFNRIDKLVIKNNTTLLLKKNANLLKEFYSGVDVNGNLVPAVVSINDETKSVTKNVDNRIYMLPYNNLNITTTQDATSYGKVTGMTFYGMYNPNGDGTISYGVYDYNKNYGDVAIDDDLIVGSSYVLGLHHTNHDITIDGFYTNVFNEDESSIVTEYIEPSPPNANFYRWMIGIQTVNYTVDLTASKYSSLGTYNLTMLDFSEGDTKFEVIDFNSSGLNTGNNLIDPDEVPRLAESEEIANSTFGLAMKSETREWTNYGTTEFLGINDGDFTGDKIYKTDSQKVAPSLMFYLYHPKNITKEGEIGSLLITLQSEEKINEIESKFNYVTITVNIVARNYDDKNSYDASITYDKKYELPSATSVNITNRSQFTAYYSLYATGELKDIYGVDYNNYHVLTSTYAFPVGTQITMIDYGYDINNPQYYYFDVNDEVYQNSVSQLNTDGEAIYRLSDFIKMGSTSLDNTYDDLGANKNYYDGTSLMAMEEFVFIFDLKETTMTGQDLDNSILFELRSSNDEEVISVLGIRRQLMQFSLYDSSNVVLQEKVTGDNEYLYYNMTNKFNFQSIVGYDQTSNGASIIDTNYESSAMGLNMYVFDKSGNHVSSSLLVGTVLSIDGNSTFADGDGVFRTRLAGKVSNLSKTINLIVDKTLPPGQYTLRFILFASADGRHNSSLEESSIVEIPVTVVGDDNAIKVTTDDKSKVVDGDTGLNELKTRTNTYVLTYRSVLVNPNIRVNLYKRDIAGKDTTIYNEVDFNTLFTNKLNSSQNNEYVYEKAIDAVVNSDNTYNFQLQDKLTSGTYKLVFRLYDGKQLIEEENEYIIVTKDIVK